MHRRALMSGLVSSLPFALSGGAARAAGATVEGFAADRLARIRPFLQRGVDDQRMAGAVWRIARRGRLVSEGAVGFADLESRRPMTRDAMFRIFSMTKPVTVATAMSLYEEGRFDLHDPVAKYIPEFGEVKVQTATNDAYGARRLSLAPPKRPLMVLDLMRHTAGLSYEGPRDADGASLYAQLGVTRTDVPLEDWVRRLAAAPLVREPGTGFDYGYGLDVVGRLVEIWSGQPFDTAMRERVLAPLGMSDTGFWTPPEKAGRMTTLYSPGKPGALLPDGSRDFGGPVFRSPLPPQDGWRKDPVLKFGGAGLVSTLGDYAKFLEMLRGRGAVGGVRVLAPLTVDLMHADLLGAIPARITDIWGGYGFGLGMEVDRGPAEAATLLPAGAYDWGGAASTWMWVDPRNEITGELMLQVYPSAPRWGQLYKQLVYSALLDPA